jgi:hypothetical protein
MQVMSEPFAEGLSEGKKDKEQAGTRAHRVWKPAGLLECAAGPLRDSKGKRKEEERRF